MSRYAIIDRGRGPELAGTRITVYDVFYYLKNGHGPTYIAAVLGVSTPAVEMCLRYIDEHRAEVEEVDRKIEERIARGNPPEIEERIKESHAKLLALRAKLRAEQAPGGINGSGDRQ